MSEENLKHVIVYTDGACLRNPGPGGYGVVLHYGNHNKELSEGFRLTTNNRMELMAAIAALEALKTKCKVTLYTDSQLLVGGLSKGWVEKWQKKGWKRGKKWVLNADLWKRLAELIKNHEVELIWVKGHAGNRGNERADDLSMQAAQYKCSNIDVAYEEDDTQIRPPLLFSAQESGIVSKKQPILDEKLEANHLQESPVSNTAPQRIRCHYCGKEVGFYFNEELDGWVTIAHFDQHPVRRFGFGANMQIHCQGSNQPPVQQSRHSGQR